MNLTCSELDEELAMLESDYALQVQDITGKRQQNQVAGYIGAVFFLPALLATDSSTEAKEKIENINRGKDELYKLKPARNSGCDTPPGFIDNLLDMSQRPVLAIIG